LVWAAARRRGGVLDLDPPPSGLVNLLRVLSMSFNGSLGVVVVGGGGRGDDDDRASLHWRKGIAPTGYYDEPGSLSEKKNLLQNCSLEQSRSLAAKRILCRVA
jgi:hypothetical protein